VLEVRCIGVRSSVINWTRLAREIRFGIKKEAEGKKKKKAKETGELVGLLGPRAGKVREARRKSPSVGVRNGGAGASPAPLSVPTVN
jgi:hypothetical protein